MNGLDDYKNILSGGIRVVEWNVIPSYGDNASTPTITLNIGEAFITELITIEENQRKGNRYVRFPEIYTYISITFVDTSGNSILLTDTFDMVAYSTRVTFSSTKSICQLNGYRIKSSSGDGYNCYSNYHWLVLRIA